MRRITSYTCIQTFHLFSLSLREDNTHTRLSRSTKLHHNLDTTFINGYVLWESIAVRKTGGAVLNRP